LPGRHHFATLDGLRGIAAFLILGLHVLDPFHLKSWLPHAHLAVDFFFCLSGFVIAYAYEGRLLSTMTYSEFAVARTIRLYPLILVGLLFGFFVFASKEVLSHEAPFTSDSLVVLILQVFLIPFPPMHGKGWPELMPYDPPAWSLFFEFVANFAYAALVTRLTKFALSTLLVFSAFVVLAQAYIMDGVAGGNIWHTFLLGFGRVFFPFFCGVFLFRYRIDISVNGSSKFSSISALAILVVLLCPVPHSINWLYEGLSVTVLLPLIITNAAVDAPQQHLASVYLFLGRISYPLYILHYPFVHVFSYIIREHSLNGVAFWIMIGGEMISAVGLAFVVMKFLDEPIRRWLTDEWSSYQARTVVEGIKYPGVS
jgi:peptidoglycan/LPS O-acetylase OafA/YrhL